MMNVKHLALAAGAVAVAVGSVGGLAAADGGHHGGWRTVRVEFTPTAAPPANTALVCDVTFPPPVAPGDPAPPCVQVSTITATQSGDLVGSTLQASTIGSNGVSLAVLSQNVTGTFSGSVKGCGRGVMLYSGRGNLDLTTGRSTMTYAIVEGSGTGDLAGITGTLRQTMVGDAPAPISGTLRCRPGR